MDIGLRRFSGQFWKEEGLDREGLERRKMDTKAFINMVFSTVMSVAPMMSDNRPIWRLLPRFSYLDRLATAWDNATKALWEQLDMSMQLYRGCLDAFTMKVGIFKVHWDKEALWGGNVQVDIEDPRTFFIAPGYNEIWKAPYCGTRKVMPVHRVRSMFPGKKIAANQTHIADDENFRSALSYSEQEVIESSNQYTTLYELWIRDASAFDENEEDENGEMKPEGGKRAGRFVYFTPDTFLGIRKSPGSHGLPPYVELWDYIRPHSFLGIGEADQIADLTDELNLQFAALANHVRQFDRPNRWIDVSQGTDPANYKTTADKGGNTYTFDSTSAQSAKPPVVYEQVPQLPPEVGQGITMLMRVVEEITGVTDVTKGMAQKNERQTAAEIGILLETSNTRTRQRVRNLEWSLKRVLYLITSLAMEHYNDTREITFREDDAQVYDTIGNSKEYAQDLLRPDTLSPDPNDKEAVQQFKAYERFMEAFGEKDKVLFDFQIVIETNSSLPMDKQSQANLLLNLYKLKVVDAQAVLETLRIPGWEEIIKRMQAQQQQALAAKQGGAAGAPPPQGGLEGMPPMGQIPQDTEDLAQQQGGQNAPSQ